MNQKRNLNQWEQVGGGSVSNNRRWEPMKQQFDPNNPPTLVGYFKDLLERNNSRDGSSFHVAEIQLVNPGGALGEVIDVAGGSVLDDQLKKIPLGSFMMLKYCGKVRSKSSGKDYNNWETFVDKGAIPFQNLGGSVAPVAQAPAPTSAQNSNAFIPTSAPAPTFQQQPAQTFQPQSPANPAQPFQQQSPAPTFPPVQPPAQTFQQPTQNANPVQSTQSAAPAQGGGQFGGKPLPPNPFNQQSQNDDLPY